MNERTLWREAEAPALVTIQATSLRLSHAFGLDGTENRCVRSFFPTKDLSCAPDASQRGWHPRGDNVGAQIQDDLLLLRGLLSLLRTLLRSLLLLSSHVVPSFRF